MKKIRRKGLLKYWFKSKKMIINDVGYLCAENDRKDKMLKDIKSYIKNSDLDKMLWGKELMEIIEKN